MTHPSGHDLTAVSWHKSSRSTPNGNCVEIAFLPSAIATRDSKHPHGPVLTFSGTVWDRFLTTVKDGRLSRQ